MPRIAPRLYFPALSRDQLAGGNRSFPLLAVNVPRVRVRAKLLRPANRHPCAAGLRQLLCQLRNERRENDDWNEPYRPVDYNMVPGRTVFDEQLALGSAPDTAQDSWILSWDRMLAGPQEPAWSSWMRSGSTAKASGSRLSARRRSFN